MLSVLMWQVLYNTETLQCEVALTSAAIPNPLVLKLGPNPTAMLRTNLHTGAVEVGAHSLHLVDIHAESQSQ